MQKISFVDQLKNLKHGQQLLAMGILLLVISVAWIFLGIFAGQQSTIITSAQKKAATPLTPQLDETVLAEIENKRAYTQSELENFPIYKVISIDRGRQQTVVPITFDENELIENTRRSGTLQSLSPSPTPETNQTQTESPQTQPQSDTNETPPALDVE